MNSARWWELRKRKLQEFPFCELHEKQGMKVRATCIHHIREIESGRTECHHKIHQAKGYNTREAHQQREDERLARWINKIEKRNTEK